MPWKKILQYQVELKMHTDYGPGKFISRIGNISHTHQHQVLETLNQQVGKREIKLSIGGKKYVN